MRLLYAFPEPFPINKARGVQVAHTVRALAEAGVQVDFAYVPVEGATDPFAYYGFPCPAGVRLVPLSRRLPGILGRLRIQSNRFFLRRLLAWLTKEGRQGTAPDLVFVRHLKLADGLLAGAPGLPLAYEAHEVFADTAPPKKRQRLARLEKRVLTDAAAVLSISSQLAALLRARYGVARGMAIVPSATTLPLADSEKDWTDLARRIVYAGSLYPWKGVEDLVQAAGQLEGCQIRVIGGDAAGIARLRAAQPGAGAAIDYLGHLPHAEATACLGEACIAVLPNRAGSVSAFTSPLKLFEYMAAGCAVVASDLPVFREVLGPDDAAWFEAGNPGSLAAALRSLVADPARARALGEKMRRLALDYTWDARARKVVAALAARPAPSQAPSSLSPSSDRHGT